MLFSNPAAHPFQRLLEIVPGYFMARALLLLALGSVCLVLMFLHLNALPEATTARLVFLLYALVSMLANGYLVLWYPLREAEGMVPGQRQHPLLLVLVALTLALALYLVSVSASQGADARVMAFSLILPTCSAAGLRWTQSAALLLVSGVATLLLLDSLTGLLFAALIVACQLVPLVLFKSMIEEFQNRVLLDLNLAELKATQELLKQSVAQSTRHAIARDLHDELGHLITRLHHTMQALQPPTPAGEQWQQANDLLVALRQQIRAIALQMRQSPTFELRATLNLLGQSIARPTIEWQLEQLPEHCPAAQGEVIFRICQEAITNCLRHADASRMRIHISQQPGQFLVQIQDNGQAQNPIVPGGGLAGLQERVAALGGSLRFESGTQGFALEAHLPVTRHDALPAID